MRNFDTIRFGPLTAPFRLSMAIDFYNVGKERSEIIGTLGERLPEEQTFPSFSIAATCLSFSIELSLKGILEFGQNSPIDKIHSLFELFNKLDECRSENIFQAWSKIDSRIVNASNFKIVGYKHDDPNKDNPVELEKKPLNETFLDFIKSIDRLFVDSRYLYETIPKSIANNEITQFPLLFMVQLANVLIYEFYKLCPEVTISTNSDYSIQITGYN